MDKVKPFLATMVFVVWATYVGRDMKMENLLLQGIMAIIIFSVMLYYSKVFTKTWVYYGALVAFAMFNHLSDGAGYFFFFLSGLLMLMYLLYKEI